MIRMAAYDFWLRGMARLRQGTPEADQEARRMFEQALVVDPHCSRAYAGLSLPRETHMKDKRRIVWRMADCVRGVACPKDCEPLSAPC